MTRREMRAAGALGEAGRKPPLDTLAPGTEKPEAKAPARLLFLSSAAWESDE
jgi:hypothetical protein